MYIQTMKYASPKTSNSNEPTQSRIARPGSAQIRSITAFDDFAQNSETTQQQQHHDDAQMLYSQSDLCLSPLESLNDSPNNFRFRRQHHSEGFGYQTNNGSYFINFDGSPTQHPELNSIQYVRPSMYMFSTDSQGNFITPRPSTSGVDKVRWKSSQSQSRPGSRNGMVPQQTMAFLPNLAHSESTANFSPSSKKSPFKYAKKKTTNFRLGPQKLRVRKKTYSENSHLSMNANIVRAQIAKRKRQQSIEYTGKATKNLLQPQSSVNPTASGTNSSSENYNGNESESNSSRMHSSRSISPLDDQSQYYVNLARKRQIARQRAAAAAKLIKRKSTESKAPRTDRHRYRDEKIKRLTDLNTQMTDSKLDIWSHVLAKESWNSQVDMFDSHWFDSDQAMTFQQPAKVATQDIQQLETLINGKGANTFFRDLETYNCNNVLVSS